MNSLESLGMLVTLINRCPKSDLEAVGANACVQTIKTDLEEFQKIKESIDNVTVKPTKRASPQNQA